MFIDFISPERCPWHFTIICSPYTKLISVHPQKLYTAKRRTRLFKVHSPSNEACTHQCNSRIPSQILGPLIALGDPLLQFLGVPSREAHLERLRFCGQSRGNGIAVNCIQDRAIFSSLGGVHLERSDQAQEGRVQFPVGQVRASTHARTSTIAVVRGAGCLSELQVPLRDEFFWLVKVLRVVVCGPSVLMQILERNICAGQHANLLLTMKNVVPAGITLPFHSMSLVLWRGRQIGMTVQNRRTSFTNAVT